MNEHLMFFSLYFVVSGFLTMAVFYNDVKEFYNDVNPATDEFDSTAMLVFALGWIALPIMIVFMLPAWVSHKLLTKLFKRGKS